MIHLRIEFDGEVIFWKGPAPWFFVPVPEAESSDISAISSEVTYGWGVIPATIRIGKTEWKTSLFPKDGGYLVPVKAWVREREDIDEGDLVHVVVNVG